MDLVVITSIVANANASIVRLAVESRKVAGQVDTVRAIIHRDISEQELAVVETGIAGTAPCQRGPWC